MIDERSDPAELENDEGAEDLEGGLGLEGRLMVEEGEVERVDLLLVAVRGHDVAVRVCKRNA